MRILIISDVHANYAALQAVFHAAGSYDALWCLGDIIGYGPEPNECAEAVKQHATLAISGNHDLACIGALDLEDFNPDAWIANVWNKQQLKPKYIRWLTGLAKLLRVDDQFTIAHASPREPVWEYLMSPEQALANADHFDTQCCLIGHSHVQLGFLLHSDGHCERFLASDMPVVDLSQPHRFFINPGSVGQPRDYDSRAAYAILDTNEGTIRFHRVEYDIARTQQKMYKANLPIALIRRLEFGM